MYLHTVHAFAGGKNLAHLKARTLKNRDRIVEFFFLSFGIAKSAIRIYLNFQHDFFLLFDISNVVSN